MNLLIFEQDKAYVQRCLENGEIDYMEVASEEAETEFSDNYVRNPNFAEAIQSRRS